MSVLLAVGALPLAGTPAAAAPTSDIVLPAADRYQPRNAVLSGRGDTGLLSQPEGSAHLRWTDYATGVSRDLPQYDAPHGQVTLAQSDTAYELTPTKPYVVRFYDLDSGATKATVTVPEGLAYAGTAGETVIAYLGTASDVREVHLLKPTTGGGTTDLTVTGWPEGAQLLTTSERDAKSLLMRYRMPSDDPKVFMEQLALVDVGDGSVAKIFDSYKAGSARAPFLSHDYVGWWYPGAGARLLRRDDLGGAEIQVPAQPTQGKVEFRVVGDHVVVEDWGTHAVLTMPVAGGEWRQLFPRMGGWIDEAPDGSAIVQAGTGPKDWGVQRLTQSPEGQIVAREIIDLPPVPAAIDGVSLANGTLAYTDQTSPPTHGDVMFNTRTVTAGDNPQVGPVRQAGGSGKPCIFIYSCVRLFGAGDGSVVYYYGASQLFRRTPAGEVQAVLLPESSGELVAAHGRYAVFFGGITRKKHLVDWAQSKVVSTHAVAAATVWDGQLWTTTSTAGRLSMSRLGSGLPAVSVDIGAACFPSELQVVGRWVYWACEAQRKAGVFDRSRGRSVPVPVGHALLADGFLVRHDTSRGQLVRTAFGSGQAVSTDLAPLPATENLEPESHSSDRRIRWTVDPNGNRVAFVDASERIHLVYAGPTAAPVYRDHVGQDGIADLLTLNASGSLTFQHGDGAGKFAGSTSGSGWSTSVRAVPFGDLNGDRCNDVLVRVGGELRAYKPGCGKALTPTAPYTSLGTAWAQFNVLTSPGDMTGDGRPDLVARQASTGDMYLYADNGAGGLKARGRIGTNWKLYRAVFGAGDLNGDGIGELLAVDGTNSLWRYNGTAAGTVKPRVLAFGNNWGTGRNAFVGVGDITGDGKADLLSRNAAGDLLRNSGTGTGSFGSTTKIATGWQAYKGIF
ncbi:VCBS repeat-containing protein [Streptomyces sp. NPDC048479]|uniref:FG-GAP repeat domain-containing protein n=1 Tax=Streptomyces sp. NPDC048479 TaxID=3154725 RepID=UPI00342AC98E